MSHNNPIDMLIESQWAPRGTQVESNADYMWTPIFKDSLGIPMESKWNPFRIHVESTWNPMSISLGPPTESHSNPVGTNLKFNWTATVITLYLIQLEHHVNQKRNPIRHPSWNPIGIEVKSHCNALGMQVESH